MIVSCGAIRPLPVVLPALPNELLSSWLRRHADFYRVSGRIMLRHSLPDASSLRELDLSLTDCDQNRLGEMLRCDPLAIRNMTHLPKGKRPAGLIATVKPMQICRRCARRHQAAEITHGARLRSWMEGWRLSCPVCGARLEDARALDLLTKVDAAEPLLVRVADRAGTGERIMGKGMYKPAQWAASLIELMRILLLPRLPGSTGRETGIAIPRMLDVIVPGFDRYLQRHYPDFSRPGTLLLAISVRIPVLAGLATVMARPNSWVERLLGVAGKGIRDRLAAWLRSLPSPLVPYENLRIRRAIDPPIERPPALAKAIATGIPDFSLIAA